MFEYHHTWAYNPSSGHYRALWPVLLADVTAILGHVASLGVATAGPDGTGDPILDGSGIAFNGTEAQGAAQPLKLAAPHCDPYRSPCGNPAAVCLSCHTSRHPYDLAVTAVLLRFHQRLGHDFSIRSSHAEWDDTWLHGLRPGQPRARQILTVLFGQTCAVSPLTWPVQHP